MSSWMYMYNSIADSPLLVKNLAGFFSFYQFPIFNSFPSPMAISNVGTFQNIFKRSQWINYPVAHHLCGFQAMWLSACSFSGISAFGLNTNAWVQNVKYSILALYQKSLIIFVYTNTSTNAWINGHWACVYWY